MKSIWYCDAFKEFVVLASHFVIDIQEADLLAISEFGNLPINAVDDWHHGHVVVARKDAHQDNFGAGSLLPKLIENSLYPARDFCEAWIILDRRLIAYVICADE